ncbi:unnamed protein product [Ceutorhynchus assimilis]|uniref:Cytochrome P450 n=1 Tax=Ceutorhynchus assimilis TaxID=467358 RepID=A0A9N9MLT8_9CUCU|nr:unnamed protein product [Ceutorhynchus assimilis]
MIVFALVLVAIALFYYIYNEKQKKFSYWKNKGVPQLPPHLIYGNLTQYILQKQSSAENEAELYFKFKQMGAKHGGIYYFGAPKWLPIDPELIKSIVTSDFQHFQAHLPKFSTSLLFNNIFHMSGDQWRDTRRKLTPTFTSGKMKMMFEILLQKTNGLSDLVDEMAQIQKPAEIKELIARYTTDVIANIGFGIECDSLKNIDSEFFQTGQNLFKRLLPKKPPTLFKLLLIALGIGNRRRGILDIADLEDFFRNIVFDAVKYRETNNVVRKDFLHLMIQLKNQGSITDLVNEKDVLKKAEDKESMMSMEDLAGQCMLFFTAGFETSSTTTSYALLELAQNQNIQDKLRTEIREILKTNILSYESLNEMTYLDNVVSETLRKYPPLSNLPRVCTKSYNIPGTDIVLDEGTMIDIPLLGLQNDPDFFPEPQKFKPERFNSENKHKILSGTYLPFGEGPRQCLGLRFGLMQTKTALASLINNFKFTLNQKTSYPPEFDPTAPILSVKGGIWLDAHKMNC